MAEELDLGRPAAEIFEARVDEPEAEVLRGARPAVNGVVVLHGRVDILVALVEVGGEMACCASASMVIQSNVSASLAQ